MQIEANFFMRIPLPSKFQRTNAMLTLIARVDEFNKRKSRNAFLTTRLMKAENC